MNRCLFQFPLGSRQNHLFVAVVVGRFDSLERLQFRFNLRDVAHHRHHRTGIHAGNGLHRLSPSLGKAQVVLFFEHPGCPQGGQFAKAVPGGHLRAKARLGQYFVKPQGKRPNRRLGVLGLLQPLFLGLFVCLVEDGDRVHHLAQWQRLVFKLLVQFGKAFFHGWEVPNQVLAHVQVRGTLPGEQRRHLARNRLGPVKSPFGQRQGGDRRILA